MHAVAVRILHPEPGPTAGPLERALAAARSELAHRHRSGFLALGVEDATVVAGPPDDTPFGGRLRSLVGAAVDGGATGLVVLGSGAMPLATAADLARFVATAASGERSALANNRYSADAVAVGRIDALAAVPDLVADNALPRWLAEVAGFRVADLRSRARLGIDLDSPLDLLLVRRSRRGATDDAGIPADPVVERLERLAAVATDRRGELLVAGRTSATALGWLERRTACRVRAFIEERGLRAADRRATGAAGEAGAPRPPRSLLATLLDRDGPASIGGHLATLSDGAIVDSRVLLAHRLGLDERAWPRAEDRFASDLLLPDRIQDPWLRELTAAARDAPIPILLGGHTVVGPGIRLVIGGRRGGRGNRRGGGGGSAADGCAAHGRAGGRS